MTDALSVIMNRILQEKKKEKYCLKDSVQEIPDNLCPYCKGQEWVLEVKPNGSEVAKECVCSQEARARRRLKFANIPDTYKDVDICMFNNLNIYREPKNREIMKTACAKILDYLVHFETIYQEKGKGLYIYSKVPGSGKTTMAAGIANKIISMYKLPVKFVNATKLIQEIKDTYQANTKIKEGKLLAQIIDASILVIDDFGTEKATDWSNEKFYYILNERFVHNKTTFFTSNYSPGSLCNIKSYDSRITDRIREKTLVIHFAEESVRLLKARQEELIFEAGLPRKD